MSSAAETLGVDKISAVVMPWLAGDLPALKLLIFTTVLCSRDHAALQYLELYWGGEELLFLLESLAVLAVNPGAADLERVLLLRGDITVWELQSERYSPASPVSIFRS